MVVFEAMQQGTSPGNVIEDLCSVMFARDFKAQDLDQLQVFEIDRNSLGVIKIQHVHFKRLEKVSARHAQPLCIKFEGDDRDFVGWRFYEPRWNTVDEAIMDRLNMTSLLS